MRRVAESCQRLGWGIARTCLNKSSFERCASSSVLEASMDGNRAVLRLAGRDVYSFLQGLLTNDVHEIESKRKSIIYSAMLNPQGRFMYDMFLLSESKSTEEPVILMDVESQTLPDLMRSLIRYRLRAAVDICDVSEEYTVKVLFGDDCSDPSKEWHVDPRLPCLGYRSILLRGEDRRANNGTALDYLDWRVENGVAEGCLEIPSGSAFPFEYNLDGLMGINFSKGCYVGQELTARTKYRGVVRKRLLPVHLSGQHLFAPGEAIFELGKTGRSVGQMRVVGRNGKGLAHLRLTAAFSEEDRCSGLHIQGDDSALIHPFRPSWWDSSWGHEEE